MAAPAKATGNILIICPFCGVATDTAHETQAACIDALRHEILRVRDILERARTIYIPGRETDEPVDHERQGEPTL